MGFMNGCNSHMGGMTDGTHVKGRYSNDSTTRNSMSKGGVNKSLGGGADTAGSPGQGKVVMHRKAGDKQLTKGSA